MHTPSHTEIVTEYASIGNRVMPLSRPLPRRLLGIWAHPDDEAYLSAGLMARMTDSCLTRRSFCSACSGLSTSKLRGQ